MGPEQPENSLSRQEKADKPLPCLPGGLSLDEDLARYLRIHAAIEDQLLQYHANSVDSIVGAVACKDVPEEEILDLISSTLIKSIGIELHNIREGASINPDFAAHLHRIRLFVSQPGKESVTGTT